MSRDFLERLVFEINAEVWAVSFTVDDRKERVAIEVLNLYGVDYLTRADEFPLSDFIGPMSHKVGLVWFAVHFFIFHAFNVSELW